jgi:hypothetical protein
MASIKEQTEVLNFANEPKPKLPIGLNILTILTLIWCAYELYSNLSNFFKGRAGIEELEKAQEKMATAPSWAKKMMGPDMMEFATKSFENRIPLLIVGLIATGLCIYGALEMRKQKKQGYFMWLVGEILPWIGLVLFTGMIVFKTFIAWFLIVPLIFILLYTLQRKNLTQ